MIRLARHALGLCVAVAMLVGCGGAQVVGSGAMPPSGAAGHVGADTGSACGSVPCCPPLDGGTGILPDGDLSQAGDFLAGWFTWKKHYTLAPDWTVSKGSIDIIGSEYWKMAGLCSVDLDGYSPGGIESVPFRTKPGASYTLTFLLSGNGETGPTTKTIVVSLDRQSTEYMWNISGGNDAQHGDYSTESWGFKATKHFSLLKFTSKDPPGSASGPVIAGMAITKD